MICISVHRGREGSAPRYGRRALSLCIQIILLFSVLSFLPVRTFSTDMTTTVPQSVLNQYAAAVGTVSNSETYDAYLYFRFGRSRIKLFSQPWTWNVRGGRYQVTSAGVKFVAYLSAHTYIPGPLSHDRPLGESVYLRQIEIPCNVQFDAGASALKLTLASTDVPVFLTIGRSVRKVGTVNIAPYFSASIPVGRASFSVPGGNITGSVTNVSVQFSDGSISITNDFRFQ